MNKFLMFLLIIGAVFIFVLGGGAGVMYQIQQDAPQDAPQIERLQKAEASAKILSSKVIFSINAHGKVLNIDGRNITLESNEEVLTIKLKDNAKILSAPSVNNVSNLIKHNIDFKEIKEGDTLSINIKILSDGTIEGQSVIIFPK